MDFYDDPLWEWNKPYLGVEDVRPIDEQGDAEVWGVPEALNQYIFQFLSNIFFALTEGFLRRKMLRRELQGTAF